MHKVGQMLGWMMTLSWVGRRMRDFLNLRYENMQDVGGMECEVSELGKFRLFRALDSEDYKREKEKIVHVQSGDNENGVFEFAVKEILHLLTLTTSQGLKIWYFTMKYFQQNYFYVNNMSTEFEGQNIHQIYIYIYISYQHGQL